jgi:8-hydroxy-5-deazaflavin:NADPH oxidoreductase
MPEHDAIDRSRRALLGTGGALMLSVALRPQSARAQSNSSAKMRIGVIGSGHIGGTVGGLWVKARHPVLFTSLHPEELKDFVAGLGALAQAGTVDQAIAFGDALFIAVPYGALPQIGQDLKVELAGKILLDTGNPYPGRDGDMANEARRVGTGVASPRYLPGVRLVRAFNAINSDDLTSQAHRSGQPIAIPLAGDDPEALAVAQALVRDAGFEPVLVGPLSRAREFDVGTPVYTVLMTAPQLRQALGLK